MPHFPKTCFPQSENHFLTQRKNDAPDSKMFAPQWQHPSQPLTNYTRQSHSTQQAHHLGVQLIATCLLLQTATCSNTLPFQDFAFQTSFFLMQPFNLISFKTFAFEEQLEFELFLLSDHFGWLEKLAVFEEGFCLKMVAQKLQYYQKYRQSCQDPFKIIKHPFCLNELYLENFLLAISLNYE